MQKIRKIVIIVVFTALMLGVALYADRYDKKDVSPSLADLTLADGETIFPWHDETENIYYYFLPSYVDLADTSFSLRDGEKISIDNVPFSKETTLGELDVDTPYLAISNDNKKYTIEFKESGNISTIYVSTATGSLESVLQSKEHKELARVTVVDENGNVNIIKTDARIKGRGNSTWLNCEKKPFSIVFNEPESILGMGVSSKWALLANAMDYSGIRNAIVYDTARSLGMATTPDYEFVDLYLNGEYNGLYMICQSAETFYERNDVDESDLYLFKSELPERLEDMNYPLYAEDNEALIDVCIPEKLHSDEKDYVKSTIARLDSVISDGGDDIADVIDIDTWIRKYLIDEVFENFDAGLASSYFYTLTSGENDKVYAGPIWDYDRVLGNTHCLTGTTRNPEILYAMQEYRGNTQRVLWYSELYSNALFYNKMIQVFDQEFKPIVESLIEKDIETLAQEVGCSKSCDDLRWGIDSGKEYEYMTDYLIKRLDFLEDIWLNNKEYVQVTFYTPDKSYNYMRVYVPKGNSIASDPERLARFSKSDEWYIEGTTEVYDFNLPVYDNTTLVNATPTGIGRIKSILTCAREELKMFVIIGSMLMLLLLQFLYKRSMVFRKGVR